MTAFKKFVAVVVAAATLAGIASQAQAYTIWANNATKNAIWFTIYLYGSHNGKQGYYCVLPGQVRQDDRWDYGNVGGGVYVRAEVKESSTSCDDHSNKYDITTPYMIVSSNNRSMATFSASQKDAYPTMNITNYH